MSTGELFWSRETFSILAYAESTRPTLERAFERVHPEDLQRVQQTVAAAARDGADLNFEHRLLLPDGSITHVHVQAHAVKGETGALEFVGALSDVTATRVAEAQLRSSEAESRQIVDAIPQMIVAMSPTGQILYANQSVLHATGLALQDVMAGDFRTKLFHPDDLERLRLERQRWMAGGRRSNWKCAPA